VIPFPKRDAAPDPRQVFLRAYREAEYMKARRALVDAKAQLAQLEPDYDHKAWCDACWLAWEDMRKAIDNLAGVPALSRVDIDRKRSAIGPCWLKAEGDQYDRYRGLLALDELRLREASGAKRGRA
jgi:hypothetical protein